jgi:oligoendopeptidase F
MTTEAPEKKELQLPAWNLSDYYESPQDPRIAQDLDAAKALADEFAAKHHGKVAGLSHSEMAQALAQFEAILDHVYRPAIFAHLLYAADSGKPAHGKLVAKTQERAAGIDEATLFFGLELLDIEEAKIDAMLAAPEIAPYKHYIRRRRLLKDHKLSEKEEKLLSKTNLTGHGAWTRMFHEIVDHQKYYLAEGAEPMGFSTASSLLYDADRSTREAAALAITRGLEPLQRQLVFLFNTILLDKKIGDEVRGFKTPMDSRNIANETDLESVQAMLDACDQASDICHRYYKLKKELLGVDELMDYDRYAPLPGSEREIAYGDARALVL